MSITTPTLSLGVNLPAGWSYHGCYTDYERRKLAGPSYATVNMTQEACVAFCNTASHPYAGVEYGQECFCGLVIGAGSEKKEDTECSFTCPGNATEACGAGNRLSVFYNENLDYTRTNPGANLTSRIGCVIDNVYARVLPVFQSSEDGMTVARCTTTCKAAGYSIAGLEYGRECFCGDDLVDSATLTNEGCDMRCAGNSTEFCGGSGRLDAYALNITTVTEPKDSTGPAISCNPTSANFFIPNGGFEQGLNDWLALAYNSSSSAFDVGVTDDALSGCAALVIPKPESKSLAQHFQISTTLINLNPSSKYNLSLSIGHPQVAGARNPISDPKYTIRLSDGLLGYGAICGFAFAPCPLTGRNNSTYTTLSLPFTAGSANETLTVYLSWYNGNFDIPLYLDDVLVQPADGNASQTTTSDTLNQRALGSSTESATSTTATEAPAPTETLGLTCPAPDSCPDGPAPLEITDRSLANSGFEADLDGWSFVAASGRFEISRTNQSLDGEFAASIAPQTPDTDVERSITLRTTLSSLNASHEWYTVSLAIGHPASPALAKVVPWVSLKYSNEVTSDIQRRAALCGAESPTSRSKGNAECEFEGREGARYQEYGMDARSFLSADGVFTDATEMDIELEIVWPVGSPDVPVFVDRVRVWEIEWGTVSR